MFDWVFGNKGKKTKGKRPPYEKARAIADTGSVDERCGLASNESAQPEILYYFATDEDWQVRRCVAGNAGTPLQADQVLAKDSHDDVRCELAYKIGRLVPALTADESKQLTDMALEVLKVLANDNLPRVRAIIAEELKHATNVPKPIITGLATDLEEIVTVPILEYSPLLRDEDLIQIIARGIKGRALIALSRRNKLAAKVSKSVVETDDAGAVRSLLENRSAEIGDTTFDRIVKKAGENREWHNAMVFRDDLPVRTIMRIASFVNAALMEKLIERNKSQAGLVEKLRKKVRKRIETGNLDAEDAEPAYDSAESRAEKMHKAGKLTEKALKKAFADHDNTFVRHGVRLLSELPVETVNLMFNSASGKVVTALAWKAGLSMETAVSLQRQIARVPRDKIVHANKDGGYPLSQDDIDWYVESYFT